MFSKLVLALASVGVAVATPAPVPAPAPNPTPKAEPEFELIARQGLATVYSSCTEPNTVALTFDDGPYIYEGGAFIRQRAPHDADTNMFHRDRRHAQCCGY